MSDIFREVDEEFRRSRAEALWSKYSGLIFVACTVLVLGVAGYRFYDWQREKAASAAGAEFEAALQLVQSGKGAEADAALLKIADGDSGIYKSLARLRAAAETAKRDPAAAMRQFDQLVGDTVLDAGLRDVARLRAGAIAIDTQPFADAERRLAPLLSANNVWRHAAQEMLAAAALKAGDLDKARQLLDTIIIDRDAPPPIKARAEVLIGLTRGSK
jgi:hypothetical protein